MSYPIGKKRNKNYWLKRRGEVFLPRKNESIPLPDNWDGIREAIINRDKVCQECGEL